MNSLRGLSSPRLMKVFERFDWRNGMRRGAAWKVHGWVTTSGSSLFVCLACAKCSVQTVSSGKHFTPSSVSMASSIPSMP